MSQLCYVTGPGVKWGESPCTQDLDGWMANMSTSSGKGPCSRPHGGGPGRPWPWLSWPTPWCCSTGTHCEPGGGGGGMGSQPLPPLFLPAVCRGPGGTSRSQHIRYSSECSRIHIIVNVEHPFEMDRHLSHCFTPTHGCPLVFTYSNTTTAICSVKYLDFVYYLISAGM